MRNLVSALVLFAMIGVSTAATDAADVLRQTRERYETINTLSVQFENIFSFEQAGIEEQQADGRFLMKKPHMFRVEMPELIQGTDGTVFWTYSPATSQIQIYDYDPAKTAVRPDNFLTAFITDEGATYHGQARIDRQRCHVVEVRPSDTTSEIEVIKVWIGRRKWIARKVLYTNRNGSTNLFNFTDIQINSDVAETEFKFQPSPNTETLDFRQPPEPAEQ